jgi:hypothetical protein
MDMAHFQPAVGGITVALPREAAAARGIMRMSRGMIECSLSIASYDLLHFGLTCYLGVI